MEIDTRAKASNQEIDRPSLVEVGSVHVRQYLWWEYNVVDENAEGRVLPAVTIKQIPARERDKRAISYFVR